MSPTFDASHVTTATEAVKKIPELGEAIVYAIQIPYSWVVLVIFFIWFFLNKDLSHITKRKERNEQERLSKIREYLEKNINSKESHIIIMKDVCDAYYFKLATGIYAESKFREALVKLSCSAGDNITWTTIRRALPFISMNANGAEVRPFNGGDKISKWLNIAMAFFFALISLTIGTLILVYGIKTLASFLLFITLPTIFFILSLFSFSQNWDIEAAEKIKKSLSKKAQNYSDLEATEKKSLETALKAVLEVTEKAAEKAAQEAALEAALDATLKTALEATKKAPDNATLKAARESTLKTALKTVREVTLKAAREAELEATKKSPKKAPEKSPEKSLEKTVLEAVLAAVRKAVREAVREAAEAETKAEAEAEKAAEKLKATQ